MADDDLESAPAATEVPDGVGLTGGQPVPPALLESTDGLRHCVVGNRRGETLAPAQLGELGDGVFDGDGRGERVRALPVGVAEEGQDLAPPEHGLDDVFEDGRLAAVQQRGCRHDQVRRPPGLVGGEGTVGVDQVLDDGVDVDGLRSQLAIRRLEDPRRTGGGDPSFDVLNRVAGGGELGPP